MSYKPPKAPLSDLGPGGTFAQRRGCRVPGCDRMADGGLSGMCRRHAKDSYAKGTSDGRSSGRYPKLTVEQVADARRMRAAFKTQADIARHFGVSVDTIRRYLSGEAKPKAAS